MTREPEDERARVIALLRRHGWNATSFQILEEDFLYWFDPAGEACVAYVDTGHAWVVAGAPIASAAELGAVAARFLAEARRARRRVCFFATERRFGATAGLRTLPIGEQPVWDPAAWEATLQSSRSLREQLRRARAKGVTVRALAAAEVADPASPARRAVEEVLARWLGARPMAPMGFLVDVQPFSFAGERLYFVAERAGQTIGFLAAVPIYDRNGWLFEDVLRDTAAPNGTTELLVDAAMHAAAALGSRYVTLGLAPLAGPVRGWMGIVREYSASLYDFRGVHAFRARLRPGRWDAIELAYVAGGRWPALRGSLALYDALSAFARGRLVSFGIATLLRGPALVVRLLAALLVPWTLLLATVDWRPFFPSPQIRAGWVAFDVVLTVGLFALAHRWRRPLGVALATAASLDALVTAAEVAAFNVSRAHGAGVWTVLAMALAAPAAAAVVLWSAVGHRGRAP